MASSLVQLSRNHGQCCGRTADRFPCWRCDYTQDLLVLAVSRSSSARKLHLAVLRAILGQNGDGGCPGTQKPALAEVLRCARSDGDANIRCAALDCVGEYLGKRMKWRKWPIYNHWDGRREERIAPKTHYKVAIPAKRCLSSGRLLTHVHDAKYV